ncbi:MAG TPA: thiamine pyrophosphate-binding protein, partial [Vicinamibacterales bacterium]|nr:thiamine pyrophosphate-binding protein [Vicinamibacterales bacterium]
MSSVADAIVKHLKDAGVAAIFGMPGGGSNLEIIDAAGHAGLPFVLTATETGAAIAAIAQAEISGKPGACLTTLGPGVASIVNGVACASLERAPLIVITDGAPTAGAFEHQRLDHHALLASVTKWSATITADNVESVMGEAIARALGDPQGPVHLDLAAV